MNDHRCYKQQPDSVQTVTLNMKQAFRLQN